MQTLSTRCSSLNASPTKPICSAIRSSKTCPSTKLSTGSFRKISSGFARYVACPYSSLRRSLINPSSSDSSQTRTLRFAQQAFCSSPQALSSRDLPQDGPCLSRSRAEREEARWVRRIAEEGRAQSSRLRPRHRWVREKLSHNRPPGHLTDSSIDRLIAQSEHLAETHLSDLDPALDLAEREVSCISILDLDFDTIAAAAGFTKQTIAAISRDPGQLLRVR